MYNVNDLIRRAEKIFDNPNSFSTPTFALLVSKVTDPGMKDIYLRYLLGKLEPELKNSDLSNMEDYIRAMAVQRLG